MADDRTWDLVIYGATGFTGRQAAQYIDAHAPPELRFAIAGRSPDKLARVEAELERDDVGVIQADSTKPDTVSEMIAATRVVLTTAGPFARYGDPVVDACVEHGTDYVDITGETPWVRDVIDRHHETAAERGIKIVPFCGFDSVPSDIGTHFVVGEIRKRFDLPTRDVRAYFKVKGGLNGGTLQSLLDLMEGESAKKVRDPLLLNPRAFLMAPVNTRVVRRSAALMDAAGQPYGEDFRYDEALLVGRNAGRVKAEAIAMGMDLFESIASKSSLVRKAIAAIGPDPGEGPSDETQRSGFFSVDYIGEAADGRELRAHMTGQGDPSNQITVTFLCESALCLTSHRDELPGGPERGGVLTPATAFGTVLADRLRSAGIELEVDASD